MFGSAKFVMENMTGKDSRNVHYYAVTPTQDALDCRDNSLLYNVTGRAFT